MSLLSTLDKKILVLDGSMGALLQGRGLPAGYAPDLWNLENPDAIESVHKEYADAGADIVLSNTFGASRIRLSEYDAVDKLREINLRGVEIARKGAPGRFVAGDVGPIGGIVAPAGEIPFEEAIAIFREQIAVLVEAGVDLIAVETMFDLMEMKAAIIAANDVRGSTPVMASMTFTGDGLTDTGTDPVTAAVTLDALNVDILATNCSTGPEAMVDVVARLSATTPRFVAAQPNAGLPKNVKGETIFEMPMETLASFAQSFVDAGVNILGGCCGSNPDYIRQISGYLADKAPRPRETKRHVAFTSRMETIFLGDGHPFVKIGEKINPTGRKKFAESLKEGRLDMALADARKQFEMGATALDVNVGVPLVDEAALMEKAVTAIQNVVPVPLVIDSSYTSALEAGLSVYPGRALVNSINGEDEKLEEVGPLVARHGASVIALLSEDEIPETAAGRLKVAEKIIRHMEGIGVPRDRIVFDVLALVVSAMQEGAKETLETIRLVKAETGCPTVAGVSNVSFGLPERKIINNGFLAMAMGAGLDGAIVNPYDEAMTKTVAAASLFAGRDAGCRVYIDMMTAEAEKAEAASRGESEGPKTTTEQIGAAIVEGDKDSIEGLTKTALDEGNDAMELFVGTMTPAIRKLGDLFAQRKKFIPHLVAAADTMKRGVAILDPVLKANQSASTSKGRVIFATVKGDIHDIGKNVCVVMLANFGYTVHDLGRNVPAEEIIAAAKEHDADIIALSALMTTTMMQMKTVIEMVKEEGLRCKVMLGGAVVTQGFADEIGADAYGRDVGSVVPVTEELMEAVRA